MQISSLGPAIRRYRKVAGLTQAELGEKTGFDPKTISRFETGTYTPSVDALFLFAEALGVKLKVFLPIWAMRKNSALICSVSFIRPPRRIWES